MKRKGCRNAVGVQVGTENDIGVGTVRRDGGARIGVGEVEVARESEVGREMAEIETGEVVARIDIVMVTRGSREVVIGTVVKDLGKIDSTVCVHCIKRNIWHFCYHIHSL